MRVGAKSVAGWLVPLVVLAVCVAVTATGAGNVASMVGGVTFDAYQRIHPRHYQDTSARAGGPVRVLEADGAALERFGAWPWPRATVARLVGELKDAGADIVVLAFPIDSPPAVSSEPPADALAQSLKRLRAVTGFTLGEAGARPPALMSNIEMEGAPGANRGLPEYSEVRTASPEIESVSAGVGALNLLPDPDGSVRSVPMAARLNNRAVPSVEAEALRLLAAQTNIVLRDQEQGVPGADSAPIISAAAIGSLRFPLRADASLEIHFAGHREERDVSAAALDEGSLAPGVLKNAIVVFAPPTEVRTPAGVVSEGDVRAEALENAILGEALRPVPSRSASLVFLIVAGLGVIVLFARANALWAGMLCVALVAAAGALSWEMFTQQRVLLDAATPCAGLALVYLTGLGVRTFQVGKTRAELKGSLSELVPVNVISRIARTPDLLKLDGEARTVTCLSCGIRHYATLAAAFGEDPAGFNRLINAAIEPLIEDAVSHGAMIGPLDGEFFTAYWNAPLEDPEHAMHACEAATRMTMSLADVNDKLSHERRSDGTAFPALEVGIGISTGRAMAGGLTARGHTSYSVTGEATVLAGRIRALSSQYGPAIVVSESTREAASRGYAFLEVDFLALSPGETPVKLYAMLGNPLVRASPKFRALATFHEHIFQSLRTQQWQKTRELIEQCRKLSGASQKIYELQLARVAWFEAHPPGPDWDGAFRQVVT